MPSDLKTPVELQWIEEPAAPPARPKDRQLQSLDDRTLTKLLVRQVKENIFVPLGLVATAACLTMGLVNLKRGDSQKQQLFMRGRVGFQAFTLAAMTLGAYVTGSRQSKDSSK